MLKINLNPILTVLIILFIGIQTATYAQTNPQDTSVSGQLNNLELKVYQKTFENDAIIQRIEKLESSIFGGSQQGPVFKRLDNLNRTVYSKRGPILPEQPKAPDNTENIQANPADYPPDNTPSTTKSSNKHIPGLMQEFPDGVTEKDLEGLNKQPGTASPPAHPQPNKRKPSKQKKTEEPPQFDPNAPSYYDTLMYVNQGKVIRWKNMPIKVFLPAGNNITYRPDYRKAAIRAFDLWKVKTNGAVDYILIDDPKKANIIVTWQDNFPEAENIGGQTSTQAGYNLNQNVAGNLISTSSLFVPGYYGYAASLLGALVGGIGNTKPKIREVKLRIGTLPSMKLNNTAAMNLIESIASHEFGHAIGLSSHSVNSSDIMFQNIQLDGSAAKIPTSRDINTITELYQHTPDITD